MLNNASLQQDRPTFGARNRRRYVVLLGIDMDEATSAGVLGFGIERIEHGHGNKRAWLQALKVFPDVPVQEGPVSTEEHPIQGFFWGDFTVRYGHAYTYRIVAMRANQAL